MVQDTSKDGPHSARRLVGDLSTARLSDTFLDGKQPHCTGNTIRKYRWALGCLERVHPTLPRVTEEIIRFVRAEPLSVNSQRVLYGTLRNFYAWAKATEDPLLPELPHVWFGTRRVGEKRGGRISRHVH